MTLRRSPSAPSRLHRSAAVTLSLGLATVAGCGPGPTPTEGDRSSTAITNVIVLPMTESDGVARRLLDQTVLVVDDTITAVEPAAGFEPPAGARIIDGEGRVLIPGLADMHVHLDHPSELLLYPAYGVTTVLNLRGLPHHLTWREEIRTGTRFGPTVWTTGDYMDGSPPTMRPMMSFSSAEDAARSVRDQAATGFDMVKVYSRLTPEQLRAIGEAAEEVGIAVIGHASSNYGLGELAACGQVNVAHGQQLVRWYLDDLSDRDAVERIVRTLADSGVTVTPNLSWTDGLLRQGEGLDELLAQPDAGWLHPAVFQPFRRKNNRYLPNAESWVPEVRERYEVEKEIVRRLHRAGVLLLAGTDASTSGVYPGDALHRELEQLVSAGLSAADALRIATRNAGRFLARTVDPDLRVGEIRQGFRADLVLLEADPTVDIRNSRRIAGVMLAGRWHPADELAARLDEQRRRFEPLDQQVRRLEAELYAGDLEAVETIFREARSEDPDAVLFSQYIPFFVGYRYVYADEGLASDPQALAKAEILYRLYAETYPAFHSAHFMLGQVYEAQGRSEEAAARYRRALAIHPTHPEALAALDRLAG